MIGNSIGTESELHPLNDAEIQRRAEHILYLESTGMPLDEAIREGDQLIAILRAFGHGMNGKGE